MKDRRFIYLSIIIVIFSLMLFVSFVMIQIRRNSVPPPNSETSPLNMFPEKEPGKINQLEPQASGQTYQNVTSEDQKQMVRDTMVGHLVSELPYEGRFFKFDYSFATNNFMLTYAKENETVAEDEFVVFLRSKGIERSWLDNLEVNGVIGDRGVDGGK